MSGINGLKVDVQHLIVPDTAVHLPPTAADADILGVADRWAAALAAEDYGAAYGMTAHEPDFAWTPALIGNVINGYGSPEPHPGGPFRVTDLETAKGGPAPRHEVQWFDPVAIAGRLGVVWFDLPLNGAWSDLTATFAIWRPEDQIVLALNEIHVF